MNSNIDNIPSKAVADAVLQLSKLPGIGHKTAIRLVLHLLRQDVTTLSALSQSVTNLHDKVRQCSICHCLSDEEICSICLHPQRDKKTVCVIQDFRDMIALESTGQFHGTYHILGGLIAPLDGIGPDALNIASLIKRCQEDKVSELIMALNPNIEGDTTSFYISKQLHQNGLDRIRITSIARGIAFGSELEYTDELTLGKALSKRLPIENYINNAY